MTALARPRGLDLDALRLDLYADGPSFPAPAWLADAAGDPAAFWRGVAPPLVASVAGSSRSSLFERYQLAHDLAARHAGRTTAFLAHDPASGFAATSYARIVEGARALAGAWLARGAVAGMTVAIIAPLSPELVSALIAAWHLGLVAAPLPVWGRTYLHDRLHALDPDFVALTKGRALWLGIPVELRLPTTALGDDPPPGLAHLYAPDEPALRVFSPLGDTPLVPLDVPAERLYLGALRDGAVFFSLGADLALAAPGWCEVQIGLPLLLTCLATGAPFVALDLADACADPALVCDGRIHVLGVHPELRDAILASAPGGAGYVDQRSTYLVDRLAGEERRRRLAEKIAPRGLGDSGPARWFRNPATAHEPERWAQLAQHKPFARAVGACYVASPLAGGAITWSAWRRAPALNAALPAPGLDWTLLDPGRGGAVSTDGNGVLSSTVVPIAAIGEPLLGRLGPAGGEQLWVTSLGAHRDGQRLPASELEALVTTRPEVWCAVLVDDPRAGGVLVVFARPDRVDAAQAARDALGAELLALIALELAPHLVPARIEVFTVTPHLGADGALDRDWCRGQHVSGRLAAKQRVPLFTQIATLRLVL